jgi:hypothetical protein
LAVVIGAQAAVSRQLEKVFDPVDVGGLWTEGVDELQLDAAGNLYMFIGLPAQVFKRTPAGTVTKILDPTGDGMGNVFNCAGGVSRMLVADDGTVFVSGDTSDNVFRVSPTGTVTTMLTASGDGAGNTLDAPSALALDSAGNLFVAGISSNNVFKVTPGLAVTTVLDATGDGAGNQFLLPLGIAVDADDDLIAVGTDSDTAFRVTPGGTITLLLDATGDGVGQTFDPFGRPSRPVIDAANNVWLPSTHSDAVFRVTPGGTVSVPIDGSGDGLGHALIEPLVPVAAASGDVYIPSYWSGAFRIAPGGAVTFLAAAAGPAVALDASGTVYTGGFVSGSPVLRRLSSPTSAIDMATPTGDGRGVSFGQVWTFAVAPSGTAYIGVTSPTGQKVYSIAPQCPLQAMPSCRASIVPGASKLVVRNLPDDRRDLLTWKWTKGEATPLAAFGTPPTTNYTACAYNAAGALILEAGIAAGADCTGTACWKPKGATGLKFVDRQRAHDGVKALVLKSGDEGRPKIVLKAGSENLLDLPLPLALPITVQLQASNGECWGSAFSSAGVRTSTDAKFVGLSD